MFDAITAPPIAFFHTMPMPCPYIEGKVERRLVADLSTRRGRLSHDELARAGFRRTQHLAYRPACAACQACRPIRVRVNDFEWTRTFRRSVSRNSDLNGRFVSARATREQYGLFRAYQSGRHDDGEMSLMDFADYGDMIERSPIDTWLIEYRDADGTLIGVMLTDRQDDGLSAVYSFFDTDASSRSLGTFMVLDLIKRAAQAGLSYVYLGYWIKQSRKMSYKTRFRPCEVLVDGNWCDLATLDMERLDAVG